MREGCAEPTGHAAARSLCLLHSHRGRRPPTQARGTADATALPPPAVRPVATPSDEGQAEGGPTPAAAVSAEEAPLCDASARARELRAARDVERALAPASPPSTAASASSAQPAGVAAPTPEGASATPARGGGLQLFAALARQASPQTHAEALAAEQRQKSRGGGAAAAPASAAAAAASQPRDGETGAAEKEEVEPERAYPGKHVWVFVHGYQGMVYCCAALPVRPPWRAVCSAAGNSWDMRLFKNQLALMFPSALCLLSVCNEEKTEVVRGGG